MSEVFSTGMGEVIDMFKLSNKARHLLAIELAYRKHQLDDESIGWQELGNILCDELCHAYGGDVFADWVMQFDNGEKSLAKFSKGYK